MGLRLFVFCLGILGFVRAQQSGSTSAIDFYTALVQVNVRCVNDQVNGLMCAAEYPDQCKEQWNFPNPCSQANIDMNVTKFVHPFDKTKFLMCGQLGKLYVVQCPQYEVFHEGCGQCVSEEAGLTASCEVPLTPQHANPCTREAILANKLFFPFPGNLSKFIHCDVWGKPWERICTPGEVWSQWDVTCVLPNLLNPCNRQTTDVNFYYKHPCDPAMYLACDAQGRAHEVDCPRGEAFHETNQRCLPYKDFKGQYLSSFCENYMFGFRKFHGNKGTAIDPSRTAETIDLGLTPDAIIQLNREGAGIKSIVSGGLLGSGQAGITIDRTKKVIGGSVSASKVTSGQGLNIDVNIGGGSVGKKTIIQGGGEGSASLDRTTQLKGGKVSGTVTTDGVSSSLDVKIGQVNVGKSGTIGLNQDITSGASSNFIDIRGKPMTTAEFIDIRRKTNDGIGANMVDIRSGPTSETKMVDIRVQQSGTQQPDIKMVDIRGSQATGSKEMVDIRGQQTGTQPMIDIRVQQSGTQQPDTKMVDIRGSQTTGSKEMVDIRGQQTGTQPMVDIRIQQSGTQQPDTTMVDIRGSQTTGSKEMVDIRGKTNDGIGANMVDIRSGPTSETKMVDIRVQQNDAQQLDTKMVDIRGSQTTGSKEMVDIRGQLTGTQPTDPKKVDVHVQVSGEQTMVDIRGKGTGTGPINTGPSSQTGNQMVDIRTTKSPGMVDIRGSQEGTGSNAKFVDIRTSQMKETGGAFVDIRSPPTSETSTGAGFVDVRTSQTGGTGTGTGFVDIRTPQSSGIGTGTDFVDIRTTQTGETGTNTGFVGIRTSQTGETGTGAGFVDIRTSEMKTGGTGTFVDIRTQQTGGSSTGTDFVDVRTPQTDGTATGTDFVDIRTTQTGGTGTGGAFVDVRTSQTGGTGTGTGFVNIRTPQSSGTGTGTDFVDIRTTQTGGTGTGGAFVDIRTSQTGGTGTGTDFVDIRTPPSSGTGTGTDFVDIRTTQTGGTGTDGAFVDIRTSQTGGTGTGTDFVDIRTTQTGGTGTGNTFVDIRTSPTGGTGTGTGFVDIRTPPASGTGANTAFVDIRTSQTGGTGTGTGFVDIRTQQTETGIGTGAGFVDIRAPPTSDSGIVVGPSMKTDGIGMTESTWVDIRGQGQGPDMTSGGQWTDIRALENQGQDTRGQTDISVVPSMDLRKELGISGGINTADASGRFVKNTITINSTMQGQEQGGTMQELLKAWNQIVGDNQGSRTGTDTSGFGAEISGSVIRFSTGTNNVIETPQNVPGNGKIIDSRLSVHPSQLRMYEYSEIPYSEPCIQENLDAGRTHFRYKGHPHMFLQCDGSGRMYRMPCSTVGRDWFDVYTNTCVDGPVHVDNLVSKR